MTEQMEIVESAQVENKRKFKLTKSKKRFIKNIEFMFPNETFDWNLDPEGNYASTKEAAYWKVFCAGKVAQTFYEPELYIIAKIVENNEIQISSSPIGYRNTHAAGIAIKIMKKKYGGEFIILTISETTTRFLSRRGMIPEEGCCNLNFAVRPNSQAK